MKNTILNILCEGQTEERFVKDVLAPYLHQFSIYPKAILLVTSRKKNAKGGMLSYLQAKRDLEISMKKNIDNGGETHLFTSMFDYYALPADFPGFGESERINDVRDRISFLEESFAEDISSARFIPYIQLHEFEALLYTDIEMLANEYAGAEKEIKRLKEETDKYDDPEMINNHPDTAPSKRIEKALRGKYNYNKVRSGALTASRIGIERMMGACRHFNEWIECIKEKSIKS